MDFQQHIDGPLVIVRWRNPTVAGAEQVSALLARRHAELGTKLVYAAVIGMDAPPPTPQVRDALIAGHEIAHQHCRNLRAVMLGSGLKRAMQRSILAGMGLVLSLRGKGFVLDASARELARGVEALLGIPAAKLLADLHEAGILSAEEAAG